MVSSSDSLVSAFQVVSVKGAHGLHADQVVELVLRVRSNGSRMTYRSVSDAEAARLCDGSASPGSATPGGTRSATPGGTRSRAAELFLEKLDAGRAATQGRSVIKVDLACSVKLKPLPFGRSELAVDASIAPAAAPAAAPAGTGPRASSGNVLQAVSSALQGALQEAATKTFRGGKRDRGSGTPGASLGGTPGASLGGTPGASLGGTPGASLGGTPRDRGSGTPGASLGGTPRDRDRGSGTPGASLPTSGAATPNRQAGSGTATPTSGGGSGIVRAMTTGMRAFSDGIVGSKGVSLAAAEAVLQLVAEAVPRLRKTFERPTEVDAAMLRPFVESGMRDAVGTGAEENALIARKVAEDDQDKNAWSRLSSAVREPVAYFRKVDKDANIWGKAVGVVDASAPYVLAWLWHLCTNERNLNYERRNGKLTKIELDVPGTRSKFTVLTIKMSGTVPLSNRLFANWWTWAEEQNGDLITAFTPHEGVPASERARARTGPRANGPAGVRVRVRRVGEEELTRPPPPPS
jgi:hypothetical protein